MSQSGKRTGDSGPPAQMRIRLKYADVATFIERFASHVSRSGIFIASRTPKPVGTTVRFEFLLADGKTRLIKGEGVVSWVREFDGEHPLGPHGMGLRFNRLDPDSRQMVNRITAFKRERGVRDDGAVPQPVADKDEISSPIAVPLPPLVPTFPPVEPAAPSPDADELLASEADLDETLARARAIARRLVDGETDLDSLLADDGDAALPPPPQVVLPPPPPDDVPAPSPTDSAPPAAAATPQALDPEISEPTRVSAPPVPEPELPE